MVNFLLGCVDDCRWFFQPLFLCSGRSIGPRSLWSVGHGSNVVVSSVSRMDIYCR